LIQRVSNNSTASISGLAKRFFKINDVAVFNLGELLRVIWRQGETSVLIPITTLKSNQLQQMELV
jgi:hypothetical protein